MIVINETIKEMKTWEEAEKYLAKSGLSQGHVDEQETLWKAEILPYVVDEVALAIETKNAAIAKDKAEADAKKAIAIREEALIKKAERAKLAAERMAARPKRIAPNRGATRPASRMRGQSAKAKTNKVAPAIKAATKSIFKSTSPKVSAAPKVSTIEKDD